MLSAIIRLSLRYRLLVVVISLVLMLYGSYLATTLPIDVFPDLDRPRVVILTECPGLATEEVETLVTQPIEVAVLGAAGVQDVRSQSTASLSVVYIEFDWDTDIRTARQTIQERMTTLTGTLPDGIVPLMTPNSSIMGQIVIAGMYRQPGPRGGRLAAMDDPVLIAEIEASDMPEGVPSLSVWRVVDRHDPATWQAVVVDGIRWEPTDDTGARQAEVTIGGKVQTVVVPTREQQQMELRTIGDWIARPRLRKIPGIAEVFVQGGDRKQYQILVNPQELLAHHVSLQQVERALDQSNINTSGGFAVEGETERPIRILGRLGPGSLRVIEELRKVPVRQSDVRPVLLENVARVVEGPEAKRGDGAVNGQPGVVFTLAKQPHIDTRALTSEIAAALAEVEASLPADIVVNSDLFRLRNFIDRGIFNVGEALVIGAVLVLIILFLFLMNFRTTFITLTAIPLSLVITTLVFRLMGWITGTQLSINVMTLGGIAVAMGELVDDAIVDVENIFRRLKENNARPDPRPALRVVYEASQEIRTAIVFGTIVVILVFLPLFALSGIEGRLFAPLGVAYIVSILASLLVSLTVTPVLSYYLLPNSPAAHHAGDGPLLRLLKLAATPLIRVSMAIPGGLVLATWLLVGFAVWQASRLGQDFLPPFDEGSIQVNVSLPPDASLTASNRAAKIVDAVFLDRQKSPKNPQGEIIHFLRRTGRAELDEHAMPVGVSEYILSMNPHTGRHREEVIADLLETLETELPEADIEVEQPLAHMINHLVSGVTAKIAIKVQGDDIDVLRAKAEQIKREIRDIEGVTTPVIEPIQQTEELHIRLRTEDLARYGVTRGFVAHVLQTALQGEVTSRVLEGERRFDVLVRLEEGYRNDFANLGRLRIDLPDGRGQVELKTLADIDPEGTGANAVNRENARRRIVIRCNTQNRDLGSAVREIQRRIGERVELPQGYFVDYGGQFENQQRATWMIGGLALASIAGMFVVLLFLYPSVPIVLQILNALPTAFIGGVFALVLTGQSLTVASLVGFISLGGIAVRNGILLVTHYFHLMKEEGEPFSEKMVLRGSLERLAPVLMTALTAGIGLVPLVLGGQEPGREILYPVATVILGGLITSTFCEFLIHPGLFWRFSGADAERLARADPAQDEVLADTPSAIPESIIAASVVKSPA